MRAPWRRRARRAARAGILAGAAALAVGVAALLVFEIVVRAGGAPDGALLERFPHSMRLHDRDGALLREVVGADGARAEWRDLDQLSTHVVAATIAVEDARFFRHPGIDPVGMARAAWRNLRARRVVQGGSTLSMQLARLLEPRPKTVRGKLGEMVAARRLERVLSKREILEQYLNRAPYGAGTVGVEAASRRYFGKPSAHLSLAEAALVAGLPQAPTALNPLRNPDGAVRRQRAVLRRMLATGAIDQESFDRALAEPLRLERRPPPLFAMHFSDWVLPQAAPGDVRTTLDRSLQAEIEQIVAGHVSALALGGATNAAVVVLDNERCEVRAMVGSADYWAEPSGAVNGALAPRQPGSALKPFTYALAFERGHTPASVVADIETQYGEPGGRIFSPKNFSGDYSGPVMLGDALGRSLNVPAIRVAELVGPSRLLDRLRALGFASLARSAAHYGLGLTLGNGEVTLLELAQGYAILARGGRSCRAHAIAQRAAPPVEQVITPEASFLVTHILADESLRIAAFGPGNSLLVGAPVAVKTGTSSNWRDSWAIGYTDRFTVAVWTGDFEGRSMNHLAGATGAGPLWHAVTRLVIERGHEGTRPRLPEPPPGVVEASVCPLSGAQPSAHCPHQRRVLLPADAVPAHTCAWHERIAVDVRNGLRAGEHCPAAHVAHRVFEALPGRYAAWQQEHGRDAPPAAYSPHCPASGPVPGAVVITSPRAGEVFVIEPGYDPSTQSVELRAETDATTDRITWLVDGRTVARTGWPHRASWTIAPGRHVLEARAPGKDPARVTFEVR
jgi:penicillin-binding protein 1C